MILYDFFIESNLVINNMKYNRVYVAYKIANISHLIILRIIIKTLSKSEQNKKERQRQKFPAFHT